MGLFELGGVFESIAEQAVEGDVGDPDEGNWQGAGVIVKERKGQEKEGQEQDVSGVVERCSEADVEDVTEHEEIGSEEENGEEQPAQV